MACEDNDPCTENTCDPATGCAYPPSGFCIPTVSEWGLVVMALLLAIASKIHFGRRASRLA
jgi:hypothetical protein